MNARAGETKACHAATVSSRPIAGAHQGCVNSIIVSINTQIQNPSLKPCVLNPRASVRPRPRPHENKPGTKDFVV